MAGLVPVVGTASFTGCAGAGKGSVQFHPFSDHPRCFPDQGCSLSRKRDDTAVVAAIAPFPHVKTRLSMYSSVNSSPIGLIAPSAGVSLTI